MDSLSPFPALAPVTAQVLWAIVKAASQNKAPGADGWRYGELKDWSWDLFELYAAVLRLVEAVGRWPSCIQPNVVCMLPKGGTRAAEDRRPIVLLSVLYRVWAAFRAADLGRWLRGNGVLMQGEACGRDVQAGTLSLLLAKARITGDHIAGLAMDWLVQVL